MSNQSLAKKQANKRYEDKNRERLNAKARERYQAGLKQKNKRSPEGVRDTHYKAKYGITLEQYNQLSEAQAGVCAICGEAEQSLNKNLCVDHNHETGKVRGLLCRNCNSALGKFKDSLEVLEKAKQYLINYGSYSATS